MILLFPTAQIKISQLSEINNVEIARYFNFLKSFINDLKISPSFRLEKLKGNLKDFYSIRINNQWRIIFKWENNNAFEVEILDYH